MIVSGRRGQEDSSWESVFWQELELELDGLGGTRWWTAAEWLAGEMNPHNPCVPDDFFPPLVLLSEVTLTAGNTSRIDNTYWISTMI